MGLFVEFVGCSGAGKTTLRRSVYSRLLGEGVYVYSPLELFLGRFLGSRISSDALENVILDILVFPAFLSSMRSYKEFFFIAKDAIWARTYNYGRRILLLRSVVRKIGLSHFIKCRNRRGEVVLVDEGPIHIAHIIYINGEKHDVPIDYDMFVGLAPKPDLVVYVDTKLEVMLSRAHDRGDPPVRDREPGVLSSFVRRAHGMFKKLMRNPAFSDLHVLKVDGVRVEVDAVVSNIISRIDTRKKMNVIDA